MPSGDELARRTDRRLGVVGIVGNLVGGIDLFLFLAFVAPNTGNVDNYTTLLTRSAIALAAYMSIAMPLGAYFIQRRPLKPINRWLRAERPATEEERILVLRYALDWARRTAIPWGAAAIVFPLLWVGAGVASVLTIALMITLGGLTACSLQYLAVERIMRPVAARALAGGAPPKVAGPGVAGRLTMTWILATAVPLFGAVALIVIDLAGSSLDEHQVLIAVLTLACIALTAGLGGIVVAARLVADPVGDVSMALGRVERGELDTRVDVNDSSEVGLLQAGFNRMATGLQERERLREAFGTYVDPGLTERVLTEGTDLAGEEIDVTVMFLDVRGFTRYAESAEANEVVALLNELYGLVVPVIIRHGGHANKFIGDGLLAVFGAPERLDDHADRAVAAALEIARQVDGRFGSDLRVGVGVNSGRVVAGTIGGGGRLDFTVIGDAVNTAARVEAATRQTGDDVLITEATRELLREDLGTWEERPPVPLKGKRDSVALYAPPARAKAGSAGGTRPA
jgi:adenylate cyclase